jgi:carboxyl-terminal processing protease
MKKLRLSRLGSIGFVGLASLVFLILCLVVYPTQPLRGQTQAGVFDEVWKTVNDNFFDTNFNGVNWKAVKEKYQTQVGQARSQDEAAMLINQMLAELKTSHTHFYTPNSTAYYELIGIFDDRSAPLQDKLKELFPDSKIEYTGIGVFTQTVDNKTFISAVLDGSPAAEAGLQVGDEIVAVNGQPYQPIQSFAGKAGQSVEIARRTAADATQPAIVRVTPKVFDANTMFLEAQAASTRIIEQNGRKIGYTHVWCYAGDEYQQQLETDLIYGDLKDADVLILDVRNGWGGAQPNYLNIFTARGPDVTFVDRQHTQEWDFQWQKPVLMLVNEGSRSGKEILAYGFQKYSIGPVVGSKTAGAVVGGTAFLMNDGSLLYLAVADVFVDGNQRLEGVGITPDTVVAAPLPYANGADPQLETALQVALQIPDRNSRPIQQ